MTLEDLIKTLPDVRFSVRFCKSTGFFELSSDVAPGMVCGLTLESAALQMAGVLTTERLTTEEHAALRKLLEEDAVRRALARQDAADAAGEEKAARELGQ